MLPVAQQCLQRAKDFPTSCVAMPSMTVGIPGPMTEDIQDSWPKLAKGIYHDSSLNIRLVLGTADLFRRLIRLDA